MQAFHAEENGWIEGAAILAAVAIVTLVTAGNDYSKEVQFRQLSELADAGEVCHLGVHSLQQTHFVPAGWTWCAGYAYLASNSCSIQPCC